MKSRKHIIVSILLLIAFAALGYFFLRSGTRPFQYGLDLKGGSELIYKADTSNTADVKGAMQSLKEVVERRIAQGNLSGALGALEPIIQTESAGLVTGNKEERLIVELPGVTDIKQAENLIGKTPTLEFRVAKPDAENILKNNPEAPADALFMSAELTGRYLEQARVEFSQNTNVPEVSLQFNKEGSDILARITKEHKGEVMGIFLDGIALSTPSIRDEIRDGKAQITGNFTPDQAKELVRNLNYGALPIPISLASSQTIGATLGESALNSGVHAGIIGFIALAIFLVLWYRLPGFVAVVALCSYVVISLAVFKLIPVTLTAAGVAGFVLSIGMAVDANVLIFERTKEELKKGKTVYDALHEGFARAWLSIRDSNISSIITAIVLFWIGTSAVKGFALTLGLGVIISMFTAITVSRTFLFAIAPRSESNFKRFLFSNGLHVRN